MSGVDWGVLIASLLAIVLYGLWKGRKQKDLDSYILADRDQRWYTVALSIMATQASAITFLSTPGQACVDGMRFVQFYFGLPLAMVVLSVTAVPIFHRLKVYTAYEYLERRFDQKVRTLAGVLFLVQRGLACGLTIYAPAVILAVLLGWNLYLTNLVTGLLVIVYTATGGTRAVNHTNSWQMLIILGGIVTVLVMTVARLPHGVSFGEAVATAGHLGRLNAIDFSFDWNNRYNFWSGLIGGFFLALAYFGTDQSQVGRYLSGQTIAQSRLGLLFNGLVKVPMQFLILFSGAMVFVFYLFTTPPVFFNSVAVRAVQASPLAGEWRGVEERYAAAAAERRQELTGFLAARRAGDAAALARAEAAVEAASKRTDGIRGEAVELLKRHNPKEDGRDVNYIFLTFILTFLPVGVIGLVMAAVFAAAMSSTAAELNALASTTVVDLYRRIWKPQASDRHYLIASRAATVGWGFMAILFAEYANRLGSLVEAVNILGSLFYGTILGLFLLAFYSRRVDGTAAFLGALAGEGAVIACFTLTKISFLWYNVVGCLVTFGAAWLLALLRPRRPAPATA